MLFSFSFHTSLSLHSHTQGDTIQHVTAGTTRIVFLLKGPLYFVASSRLGEPVEVLHRQLEMLHLQILLVVSSGGCFVRVRVCVCVYL